MIARWFTPGPWRYDREQCAIVQDVPPVDPDIAPTTVFDLVGAQGGDDCHADATLAAASPSMFHVLELIYANAAESPEWIRERIGPVLAKAVQS